MGLAHALAAAARISVQLSCCVWTMLLYYKHLLPLAVPVFSTPCPVEISEPCGEGCIIDIPSEAEHSTVLKCPIVWMYDTTYFSTYLLMDT